MAEEEGGFHGARGPAVRRWPFPMAMCAGGRSRVDSCEVFTVNSDWLIQLATRLWLKVGVVERVLVLWVLAMR